MSNFSELKIQLIIAKETDLPIIQNLARFYVYELSRYDNNHPRSKIPDNGLYEAYESSFHFKDYWVKTGYYSYIIKIQDELAGFALINNMGSDPDVNWDMAEFFILKRFQRKQAGLDVAIQLFEKHTGIWEVRQMLNNLPAIKFWNKVLNVYMKKEFTQSLKTFLDPEPHVMNVLKFDNS